MLKVRREVLPPYLEDRGARGELGDEEGREPDQASPHHPTHALKILRRFAPCPFKQDTDGADGHGETGEYGKTRPRLGAKAAQVAVGEQHQHREHDGDDRQEAFKPSPFAVRLVVGGAEDELEEPGIADGFGDGAGDVLPEHDQRPLRQESVEGVVLTGIEPHDVEKEAPAHASRSGPHEPCGGDHHQNSSDLIHQYDESLERVGRHLRRDQSDLPRWAVAGRLQIERRLLSFRTY